MTQGSQRLVPLVERELHALARRYLKRERPGHTLQTTALVNEAYLRLVDQRQARWQNRAQFFAITVGQVGHDLLDRPVARPRAGLSLLLEGANNILIDHARRYAYAKRGGGAPRVSLDEVCLVSEERAAELVALDGALTVLAAVDERKGRIVELRYFGGLTVDETAEVLGVHPDTVNREWQRAKAFLRRELESV